MPEAAALSQSAESVPALSQTKNCTEPRSDAPSKVLKIPSLEKVAAVWTKHRCPQEEILISSFPLFPGQACSCKLKAACPLTVDYCCCSFQSPGLSTPTSELGLWALCDLLCEQFSLGMGDVQLPETYCLKVNHLLNFHPDSSRSATITKLAFFSLATLLPDSSVYGSLEISRSLKFGRIPCAFPFQISSAHTPRSKLCTASIIKLFFGWWL